MEVKVGGEGNTSTPEVGMTMGCDGSVYVQHAIGVGRGVIFASLGEGSLVGESVDIEGGVKIRSSDFIASSDEGSL